MHPGRPDRRRATRLATGLLSAAAIACGLLALAWPRRVPTPRAWESELHRTSSPRSGGFEAGLIATLREARDELLLREREALERSEPPLAAEALARARELEAALALLEQLRRTSADPLDAERASLLAAARLQLLGAELPICRRALAELRVHGMYAELQRACDQGLTRESAAEPSSAAIAALPPSTSASIEIRASSDAAWELTARDASAAEILDALLPRFPERVEPRPAASSPLRFTLHAREVDPRQLLREAAGSLGWRLAGEVESDARKPLRWIAWSAAPTSEERQDMLRRIAAEAAALELASLEGAVRAEARFVRASALEHLGDLERALEEYALLAEQSGAGAFAPEALRRIAMLHEQRGAKELALAAWDRLLALEPEEPLRSQALLRSADLQLARGLHDAARERYERLVRSSPDSVAARTARLGRLAARFHRELEHATPQRLRLLAAELAQVAEARRDPALRSRYLALSSALLRRIGATPLALRETLAACVEEPDATRRAEVALAASELALVLQSPLAALWCLELAGPTASKRAEELREAARALLGYADPERVSDSTNSTREVDAAIAATSRELAEGRSAARAESLAATPRTDALDRALARLRAHRVTAEPLR